VIVGFVDIGGIDYHHCFNFLFIVNLLFSMIQQDKIPKKKFNQQMLDTIHDDKSLSILPQNVEWNNLQNPLISLSQI